MVSLENVQILIATHFITVRSWHIVIDVQLFIEADV